MTRDEQVILSLKGICKEFSGVKVLTDISFDINKGEIMAILGANGAGKSTLMKIIGGVHKPDGGSMQYQGAELQLSSPSDARKNGISVVYQELSLVPTLDALSNVFLGREQAKFGWINKRQMSEDYEKISKSLNFNIAPAVKVGRLSIAQQQMVEIMKVVSQDAEIIIMDEPTTSLSENEKVTLLKTLLMLKEKGKTILYISHMLDEVFKISDRITILKDGAYKGTFKKELIDKDGVISIMTGSSKQGQLVSREKGVVFTGAPVLKAVNLSRSSILKNINFELRAGEILGIAGLVGSGRTELCNLLYGIDKPDSGDILINGSRVNIKSASAAIKNGIGLIPEDRKNTGLIQLHEVYKNSTIIQLKRMRKHGFLSKKNEHSFINDAVKRLGIKLSSISTKVRNLSGGNQQKVVVSKWLGMDLKVLIFDEPTKGIDVAAKEDIFRIMADFANSGMGIIFISSDLDEILRMSDRVIAMRNGSIVDELTGDRINLKDITYSILNG